MTKRKTKVRARPLSRSARKLRAQLMESTALVGATQREVRKLEQELEHERKQVAAAKEQHRLACLSKDSAWQEAEGLRRRVAQLEAFTQRRREVVMLLETLRRDMEQLARELGTGG